MDLAEGFRNHKEKIINRWVEYVMSTYGASEMFLKNRDRFSNPVGGTIREALGKLFEVLSKDDCTVEDCVGPLEQILAIRAVQVFTPGQAIAPINAVKHITREVFTADKERRHLVNELYDFEFRVDLAMLRGFDIYMQYRERLYQVRIDEIKSGSHILTDSKCPSRLLSDDNKEVFKNG